MTPLLCLPCKPTFNLHLLASGWKRMRFASPHLQAVQQGESACHLLLCCPPQHEQMPPRQAWASDPANPLQCHLTVSRGTSSRAHVRVGQDEVDVTQGNVLP